MLDQYFCGKCRLKVGQVSTTWKIISFDNINNNKQRNDLTIDLIIITMVCKDYFYNFYPQVKALCNRAMACGNTKCHKNTKATNIIGSKNNIFLEFLGDVMGSREETIIEAAAVEAVNKYLVCADLQKWIDEVVA